MSEEKGVLFEQLYFLADIRWEERDESPLVVAPERVAQLDRLLKLDHQLLGKKAVNVIRVVRAEWKLMCRQDGNSQRRSGCCEPQLARAP